MASYADIYSMLLFVGTDHGLTCVAVSVLVYHETMLSALPKGTGLYVNLWRSVFTLHIYIYTCVRFLYCFLALICVEYVCLGKTWMLVSWRLAKTRLVGFWNFCIMWNCRLFFGVSICSVLTKTREDSPWLAFHHDIPSRILLCLTRQNERLHWDEFYSLNKKPCHKNENVI